MLVSRAGQYEGRYETAPDLLLMRSKPGQQLRMPGRSGGVEEGHIVPGFRRSSKSRHGKEAAMGGRASGATLARFTL